MTALAAAFSLSSAVHARPTVAAGGPLAGAVVLEIVLLPATVLPGAGRAWLAAAMPSLAAGALAAQPLARLGHVIGLIGLGLSALMLAGLLVARHHR